MRGASADEILSMIEQQNPQKGETFAKARERGASADDILDEITNQNPTQTEESDKGFFSRVGDRGRERIDDLKGTFDRTLANKNPETGRVESQQGPLSTAIQGVGAAAGFVGDVMGEAGTSLYRTLTPQKVQDKISDTTDNFFSSEIGKKGMQAMQGGLTKYDAWKKANPVMAANFESTVDIASLIPAVKGGAVTAQATKGFVKETAEQGFKSVAKRAAQRSLDNLAEYLKPVATKAEKEAALRQGRTVMRGLSREIDIIPDEQTKKAAQQLQGIVDPKKSYQQNIQSVNREIKNISEKEVTPFLESNNKAFNKSQVRSKLETIKTEKPLFFTSEVAEGSTYDKIIRTAMQAIEENKQNAKGLWEARKKFDNLIDERFPNLWDNPDGNSINRAISNVRRGMNDYIGELSGDDAFKAYMSRITNLYDAQSTLVEKGAKEISTNAFQRWAKANPGKARLLKFGAGLSGTAIVGNELLKD